MKKQLHINMKILLLVAVYLFFHITNSFFSGRRVIADKHHTVIKQETLYLVHLQKAAKTTISESRLSFEKLIQEASKFFILLLYVAVSLIAIHYSFFSRPGPVSAPPYLRFCVIRI